VRFARGKGQLQRLACAQEMLLSNDLLKRLWAQ
jgi:hypothetical protein